MKIEDLAKNLNPELSKAVMAAARAVETGAEEDMKEFQSLCRPAEFIALVRNIFDAPSGDKEDILQDAKNG